MIYIGNKEPKEIYVGNQAVKQVYVGRTLVWPKSSGPTYTFSLRAVSESELSPSGGTYTLEAKLLIDGNPCSDSYLLNNIDVISDGSVSGYTISSVGINTSDGTKGFQLKVDKNESGMDRQFKFKAKLNTLSIESAVLVLYQAKYEEGESKYTLNFYADKNTCGYEGDRIELTAELLHNGAAVSDEYTLAQLDIEPDSGNNFSKDTYRVDKILGTKTFPILISENKISSPRTFTFKAVHRGLSLSSEDVSITQAKAEDKYTLTISMSNSNTIGAQGGDFDIHTTLYKNGNFVSDAQNEFTIESVGDATLYYDHSIQNVSDLYYITTLGIASNTWNYQRNGSFRLKYKDLAVSNYLPIIQDANSTGIEPDIPVDERYILEGTYVEGDHYGNTEHEDDNLYEYYTAKIRIYDTLKQVYIEDPDGSIYKTIISTTYYGHEAKTEIESITDCGIGYDRESSSNGYYQYKTFEIKLIKSLYARSISIDFSGKLNSETIEGKGVIVISQEGYPVEEDNRYNVHLEVYSKTGRRISEYDTAYKDSTDLSSKYSNINWVKINFKEDLVNKIAYSGRDLYLDEGVFYINLRIYDKDGNIEDLRPHLYTGLGGNNPDETWAFRITPKGIVPPTNTWGTFGPSTYYDGYLNRGTFGKAAVKFCDFSHIEFSNNYTQARLYFTIDSIITHSIYGDPSKDLGWSGTSLGISYAYRPIELLVTGHLDNTYYKVIDADLICTKNNGYNFKTIVQTHTTQNDQ